MGRRGAAVSVARPIALAVGIAAGLALGCGEPVSVIGDTPGLMRIVAGVPGNQGRQTSPVATETQLRLPACPQECLVEATDVAVDLDGRLIVADERGHRVWRFDPVSGARTPVAGNGIGASGPDGEPGASTSIDSPRGVAVGAGGEVYISEGRGHRVRQVLPDGTLATVAGTGDPTFGGDGGPATAAALDFPGGIDVAADILYIADAGNDRIRAVDLTTGIITTVAGSGVRGFAGDGGEALAAALDLPRDVAASPDGRFLYVADQGNHRIRVVTPSSGLISTFAGTGETDYNGNLRDAGATSLDSPGGVATSPFGLVLIADTRHHIVWRTPLGF